MTTENEAGAQPGAAPEEQAVQTLGLISKRTSLDISHVVEPLEKAARDRGLRVLLDRECARHLGREEDGLARREMVGQVDLATCLGGDGTFLAVARRFAPTKTPIVGVNLGRMEFLADVEPRGFDRFLDRYLAGNCVVSERMMLDAVVEGGDRHDLHPITGLNDVVVTQSTLARILTLDLHVDGQFVTRYRADGLIIATPTGSTAYALAAGGPIVQPGMDAVVISPICPHALTQRPLIVSDEAEINVSIAPEEDHVHLSVDGQVGYPLPGGARVIVRRSAHRAHVVQDPELTFYDVLRVKLGWGDE